MIDVLVAGGGPAGLATAIHAALAGMEAVVVEPRATPVDKACGEGLMPGGVAALTAMGVELSGRPLRGIHYLDGRHSARAPFRAAEGLGVRRTVLHAALARRAAELGVKTVTGRIGSVSQDREGVEAGGLRARWLVAADGLHSPIRRSLGLGLPDGGPRRYGLRRHYRVAPWTDHVEVHWSGGGEAYVTPVAGDLVGVAILSTRRHGYAEHLDAFPALLARLRGAPATAVRGAGPLRQRVRARVAGRVLLVGDAAGYTDALTGEGVSLAVRCARSLVGCLRQGRPQEYEQAWLRLSRAHRLLTGALVYAAGRPGMARLVVPAAQRLPGVFTATVRALS
ncbi:NAD(P)/FAD-dependent oxidoreductase [Nonomuraea sp. 3-1Str]|uniref:NAD(P)/FAD-dependent oxidoreductase n=1 Tax=unclassified Nonomuraea TaxID=2593643 RepID=UPI002864FA08|nr:NAD(P)/FAD-dependent oxidoreductase [Nonomuraea sp. 3-1Str]MDR8414930.1 NAD(P)/FAD-dependent oxidoreductase [Nonomuraea sp. 3-1Str]